MKGNQGTQRIDRKSEEAGWINDGDKARATAQVTPQNQAWEDPWSWLMETAAAPPASLGAGCYGLCDHPGYLQTLRVAATAGAMERIICSFIILVPRAVESKSGAGASD